MKEKKAKNKDTSDRWTIPFLQNLGTGAERNYVIENLSLLVASGMSIITAIEALKQEVRTRRMKNVLSVMKQDIEDGMSLSTALEKTGMFPAHTISLLRIGEQSGRLAENLNLIALQQQKESVFKAHIRSAMTYPIMVLVLTVAIGTGIAWFILPKLALVFVSLKIKLPIFTRVLIAFGSFIGNYGSVFIPSFLIGLALALYFMFVFSKTKFTGQWLLLRTPLIKPLIREIELSRFGYLLGTLLTAGLPVTDALEALSQSSTFVDYRNFYTYLHDTIEEGNTFQKSFTLYKNSQRLIPSAIQQLVVAGEQSGKLADSLTKISKRYEDRTETTTKNLTVILEPLLLVIVWLGVVSVALAIILPVYNLIGGLNR